MNNQTNATANLLATKNVDNNVQTLNCKKDLKSLMNDDRNDMGSTGASDKSASSIGSESKPLRFMCLMPSTRFIAISSQMIDPN